jgi:hypothetical protein
LRDNTPTDEDRANIALSKLIVERRNEGKSWREIGEETGRPENTITGYAKRGVHRAIVEWLSAPTPASRAESQDETEELKRQGIQFIKDALAKNPDGTWKDQAMAMWATERLKGMRILDADQVQPTIEIKLHTVKEIMDPADEDEAESEFRAQEAGDKRAPAGVGEGDSSATPEPERTAVG